MPTRTIKSGCLLLALLLGACATDEPLVPPTPLTELQPGTRLDIDWRVSIGGGRQHAASYFAPAAANDTVFAANSEGQVVALEAGSGELLWRRSLQRRLSSGVAVDAQHVYIAGREGDLLALNQKTGETVWNYTMSSEILAPVAAGYERVIVRSADGRVASLGAADGREQWRNTYTPPALTLHGYSSPYLLSSGVLLGLDDGKLVALAAGNGNTLWESQLSYPSGGSEIERLVDLDADILTDGQFIYAVNYQGKLARIEPARGRQIWSVDFSSVAGLAQTRSTLFAIDASDSVLALDKNNGEPLWTQDRLRGRKLTRAVVSAGVLYCADFEGYLHALSLQDGRLLGRVRLGKDAITAPPLVHDDALLVQTTDGRLSRVSVSNLRMAQ